MDATPAKWNVLSVICVSRRSTAPGGASRARLDHGRAVLVRAPGLNAARRPRSAAGAPTPALGRPAPHRRWHHRHRHHGRRPRSRAPPRPRRRARARARARRRPCSAPARARSSRASECARDGLRQRVGVRVETAQLALNGCAAAVRADRPGRARTPSRSCRGLSGRSAGPLRRATAARACGACAQSRRAAARHPWQTGRGHLAVLNCTIEPAELRTVPS